MSRFLVAALVASIAIAFGAMGARGATVPQEAKPEQADYASMMAKAKKFIEPGKNHEILKRFIGKWDTELRFFMGDQATPPERGTSECSWLMEGRWVKWEATGKMMGRPTRIFTIMGYDNFKMSFVATTVSSMDTAMNRTEGDMDPGGKLLISYGTIDEYLTGEHDKMVKTVWRFESDDKIVMEIHDLPIGEKNTKVLEFTYTRQKP